MFFYHSDRRELQALRLAVQNLTLAVTQLSEGISMSHEALIAELKENARKVDERWDAHITYLRELKTKLDEIQNSNMEAEELKAAIVEVNSSLAAQLDQAKTSVPEVPVDESTPS